MIGARYYYNSLYWFSSLTESFLSFHFLNRTSQHQIHYEANNICILINRIIFASSTFTSRIQSNTREYSLVSTLLIWPMQKISSIQYDDTQLISHDISTVHLQYRHVNCNSWRIQLLVVLSDQGDVVTSWKVQKKGVSKLRLAIGIIRDVSDETSRSMVLRRGRKSTVRTWYQKY